MARDLEPRDWHEYPQLEGPLYESPAERRARSLRRRSRILWLLVALLAVGHLLS